MTLDRLIEPTAPADLTREEEVACILAVHFNCGREAANAAARAICFRLACLPTAPAAPNTFNRTYGWQRNRPQERMVSPAGEVYYAWPPMPLASAECPACGLDSPHSHDMHDVAVLERKAAFLRSKIGPLATEAAPAEPAEAPTSIGALYEHWERAQEAEKGPYPESGPLHERLRWWVPYSSRHGTAGPEDDLLEAVNFIAPREPAEAPAKFDTPEGFIDWFAKNYNGEVVFSDPAWHARIIFRTAAWHYRALATPPTALQEGSTQRAPLTDALDRFLEATADPEGNDRRVNLAVELKRALIAAARSPTQEPLK